MLLASTACSGDGVDGHHQRPEQTACSAVIQWQALMVEVENERFCHTADASLNDAKPSQASDEIGHVQTTSSDAWCERCAVVYDKSSENVRIVFVP